jgi:dinuclear metal center YbgI/SA1388 family protein
MLRSELVNWLDAYLSIHAIKDYGPQGLQVEGRAEVQRIVGTVDAQLPCAQAAHGHDGDLLLVHHGIFWGPAKPLRGGYGHLVRYYIERDLNLYAAHLALDAHPVVGNNAQLARLLNFEVTDWWGAANGVKLGTICTPAGGEESLEDVVNRFGDNVGNPVLLQEYGPRICRKVAILSGSGTGFFEEAAALGCDTIITGETSHAHFYEAQNLGVNILYGGHYTSETVGVKALGALLAEQFGLEFKFVDLPTYL